MISATTGHAPASPARGSGAMFRASKIKLRLRSATADQGPGRAVIVSLPSRRGRDAAHAHSEVQCCHIGGLNPLGQLFDPQVSLLQAGVLS